MSYERTGLGITGFYSSEPCPSGFNKVFEGTRSEQCVPNVSSELPASGGSLLDNIVSQIDRPISTARPTSTTSCPAGQTRAFATQQCQPVCSTYRCPTGKSKLEFQRTSAGTAAQASRTREQALVARGCTVAPCSDGPQLIDSSAKITYCCPPQAATTAIPATPPPPTIVYSVPQAQQTVSRGYGPLFWIGLGCVGVGLVLVLRKGKISKNPVPWHIKSDRPDDIFGDVFVGETHIGSVVKSTFAGPVWRANDNGNRIVKCDLSSVEGAAAAVYAEWLKKGG